MWMNGVGWDGETEAVTVKGGGAVSAGPVGDGGALELALLEERDELHGGALGDSRACTS